MPVEKGYDSEQIAPLIEDSHHIAVVSSKIAGPDAFSASVGLYYMFLEKGKDVTFIYPGKVPEICRDLINPEEISEDTSCRKLFVSIDYANTKAARVQYSTADEILHLVVSPVPRNFDRSRVKTAVRGFDFDLICTLGVQRKDDLGRTYANLREEFAKAKILNIDNTNMNARYGTVNIVDVNADTLSHLVFKLGSELGFNPCPKAARALLLGMTYRAPKS